MQEDRFKVYKERTAIKHTIFRDHLGARVSILGSCNKKIVHIYGLCGPGCYEYKGKTREGSPIIALKVAADFFSRV
jgi:hypothetical protein